MTKIKTELSNEAQTTFANPLLAAGKIVVLQGRVAHIRGNKEDKIIRLTPEFLKGIDTIIKSINEGYGNIREATLEEKEYWFNCHDNCNEDFGVCSMSSYMKWIACR